jgi:hypothetical protein
MNVIVPISIIKKLIDHELECSDEHAILTETEFDMLIELVELDNQNYN